MLLEGYSSFSKLFNTLVIPFVWYPKNILGSIFFETWKVIA
jgi:hypothetical protein